LKSLDASPLLCAGITTFNASRNLDVEPDPLVAIQGIGGLGHFVVQYANKLGYRVAVSRAAPKRRPWQPNLAPTITSTAQPSIPDRH